MIKNIIFDLGGVIITLDEKEAFRRLKELGAKDVKLDPYTQNGIFGDLELGKLSAEDFRRELSRMVKRELTFEDCKYFWLGYRKELPERNLNFLKKLRAKGYRLILLSNTNPFMMDWALSKEFDSKGSSLEDYFDALYLSYRLGTMKPSQDFFKKMLLSEGINPKESIFIDDGKLNVEVAQALGLYTMCPENGSDWTGKLSLMLNELE